MRVFKCIVLLMSIIVLTACGSKTEEAVTYKGDMNGFDTTVEMTAKGDDVVREKIVQVVDFKTAGFNSKEEVDEWLVQQKEYNKNAIADLPEDTVTIDYEVDDKNITIITNTNYEDVDIQKLIDAGFIKTDGDKDAKRISKEKTEANYKNMVLTKSE